MMNWTEERLDALLTTPSAGMIGDVKQIKGDIMILGAGGKMGPTLATLAKNAVRAAGIEKRVIAVSRFSDPFAAKLLNDNDVETISVDLMAEGAMTSCLTWKISSIWPGGNSAPAMTPALPGL